jgi:large subunit ribosomal protein L29
MSKAAELRDLSDGELVERYEQYSRELFDLRFALVTGQLDDYSRLGRVRREIARVMTVQRERELQGSESPT